VRREWCRRRERGEEWRFLPPQETQAALILSSNMIRELTNLKAKPASKSFCQNKTPASEHVTDILPRHDLIIRMSCCLPFRTQNLSARALVSGRKTASRSFQAVLRVGASRVTYFENLFGTNLIYSRSAHSSPGDNGVASKHLPYIYTKCGLPRL
jgi:hypothetical protein